MSGAAEHRAGHIAIVGRPNVGKSTLVNRLVGQKISITSRKPQTTRHRISGIVTRTDAQFVFVDTPGFQTAHSGALNRIMNRLVSESLQQVDIVLFVVEVGRYGPADARVASLLPGRVPVILVINKIDRLADARSQLPFIDKVKDQFAFAAIVPVSAQHGRQVEELLEVVRQHLPPSPPLFDAEQVTDRDERFFAAEFVREKLFRQLGDELPYAIGVVVDKFEEVGGLRRIHVSILVDRPAHKAMIIGEGGARLKSVASAARKDLEQLFAGKVFLEVWVKVKRGWADDERALRQLGYG